MVENKEGFIYPEINKSLCVDCGACKKVCPWLDSLEKENMYLSEPICYAAKASNISIQQKGSSGGIFGVFANYVLENNGLVCGAAMDEQLVVKHIIVDNKNDLEKLYGSKYVSSDLNNVFDTIKKELQENKLVLFCGVPCQVNALLKFLPKIFCRSWRRMRSWHSSVIRVQK